MSMQAHAGHRLRAHYTGHVDATCFVNDDGVVELDEIEYVEVGEIVHLWCENCDISVAV